MAYWQVWRHHALIGEFDSFRSLQLFLINRFPENGSRYAECKIVGNDAHLSNYSLKWAVCETEDCSIRNLYLPSTHGDARMHVLLRPEGYYDQPEPIMNDCYWPRLVGEWTR